MESSFNSPQHSLQFDDSETNSQENQDAQQENSAPLSDAEVFVAGEFLPDEAFSGAPLNMAATPQGEAIGKAALGELSSSESGPSLSDSELDARAKVRALAERTRNLRPTTDADLLARASEFASQQHAGQKRRTGEDYIEHPIAVAGILAELGMDDVTLAAGLLHDVPEDCGVTMEEMTERFGPEVTQLVDGVTKLKKIEFSTLEEKQAENLRKLFLAMAGDLRVIIIKLADRLHNMRTLDPFPEKRKREIAAETLYIFAPIAHRLGIWRVKWELEDRSFKFLEPEIYKQIYSKVQKTRSERSLLVQNAMRELRERLQSEGITGEVNGRPKHFYSIYQKMLKQGLQFDAIHDLIALRVVCNSVGDCYHALGMVHSLWKPLPDMFFDYIAKPKPNNYQSLHTKVLGPGGDLIEVQIRTREMHREAEYGIAAHWRYKASDQPTQDFGDKLRWLRLVLELQSDTQGDAKSFLDSVKLDLSEDQVFAFTPRGDVIYLPQGSTPIDFAFRVHSEVGNNCVGVKVNGRIAPLNYKLHNGDICEILTNRNAKGPKRGWLDFVVTPHAKNRIKSALKRHDFEDNYREGLGRLEKAAQVERLKLGAIATNEMLLRVAKNLKFRDVSDMLAAIGYGEHSAEHILRLVRAELGRDQEKPRDNEKPRTHMGEGELSSAADALLQRKMPLQNGNSQNALPESVSPLERGTLQLSYPTRDGEVAPATTGNYLYGLAKCCAPIPGDQVRGYITRGRGVTVHRVDCSNLKNSQEREPDRILDAAWTPEPQRSFQTLIAVESTDRTGLLFDVSAIFAERRVNISGINTYPLKNNRARLNLAATVRDADELTDLMHALRGIVGVCDVHRV